MYTFKAGRWSSHSLLLGSLPPSGEGRRVLDVGCGPGYLSDILTSRGYAVTAIERSGGCGPGPFPSRVSLIEHDLDGGLPPLPSGFHYILCADILEHLRDPAGLLRQLREVLAPGGVLIASLPNSGNIWFRVNVVLGRFPKDDKGLFDRTHLHFFTWSGWQDLFRSGGLRIASVEPSSIPVSLVAPPAWSESAPVRLAEDVFYLLARMRKQMFAYQFVVRATPL